MLKTLVFKYLAKLSQKTADAFHVFPEKQERSLGWKLQEGRVQISTWKDFSPLETSKGWTAWPPWLEQGLAEAAGPRAGR